MFAEFPFPRSRQRAASGCDLSTEKLTIPWHLILPLIFVCVCVCVCSAPVLYFSFGLLIQCHIVCSPCTISTDSINCSCRLPFQCFIFSVYWLSIYLLNLTSDNFHRQRLYVQIRKIAASFSNFNIVILLATIIKVTLEDDLVFKSCIPFIN